MAKESHLNISKDIIKSMDLGALLRTEVIYDDAFTGTRIIEYEFELGTVRKTQWYGAQKFIDGITELRNNNIGNKFNDGEDNAVGTKVASIPMHIWAREIAPRQKDGNQESLKKLLNSADFAPFRTKEGTI
ncbi:hypothetical protein [Phyllobacterium sophorae]|uniref:Uncharacterized protein n=1 Tax=Phyllobacterium sophorae TaxID=1520277 RepID=A0A2P7BDV6_9HYPH|nr:hypothetical protein [Phyllobacterium sophorae]PSH64660.1 hypothetical protein CU103_12315 [Phyllobacterium sophorae]